MPLLRRLLLGPFALLSAVTVVARSTPPAPAPTITLSSPLDYQVFQRSARLKGKIAVRGRLNFPADRIEARLTGTSLSGLLPGNWVRVKLHDGEFSRSFSAVPGGFYQLDLRALRAGQSVAAISVAHVGLGEVFVVAGQSNSTNYGEARQSTQSGMVVDFDGKLWQLANDPEAGVQDTSHNGSFLPAFGDALYARYQVPIGVAPVGHGSTSVRQWLPAGSPVLVMPTMTRFITQNPQGQLISDGSLFNGMMLRIHQLGLHSFRALLWHQGESDAHQAPDHRITAAQYRAMMVELIRASRKNAGWNFPWIVAEATYHSPQDPSDPEVEQVQRSLWQSGIARQGPNTDTLGSKYRQNNGAGVHFSDAGLKVHGELWAEAVERYLESVLR
jgi:hypothetical protein